MDIYNLDRTALYEELEKMHNELIAIDPDYKNSHRFNDIEETIKENKMMKNAELTIEQIDAELKSLEENPELIKSINRKAFKEYKQELTDFCFELKKIEPEVNKPIGGVNGDENRLTISIYYFKAILTIKKIDILLEKK
jgi:hypothetical protein